MTNLNFRMQKMSGSLEMVLIKIEHRNTQINCLVDTGARIPVWCAGEKTLKSYYKDCDQIDAVFLLSGFGKGYEIGNVYVIPDFVLSDGKQAVHFHNMLLAVTERDYSFEMILSYTMFHKMNLSIETFQNRSPDREMPYLRIAAPKQRYCMTSKWKDLTNFDKKLIEKRCGTSNILDSVYVFTQEP